MNCFQLINNRILIINNDKEYEDTLQNFEEDYGKCLKTILDITANPHLIIYDEGQQCYVIDDVWKEYPNQAILAVINDVDKAISVKQAKEDAKKPKKTIEELKLNKLMDINMWTAEQITGGFISSASGKPVKYDSDVDTQLTMQGIALNVNTTLFQEKYPNGCPVRGYDKDSDVKTIHYLNGKQVMQWMADLSMHIGACKQEGWALQDKISKAKNKDDLDKIVVPH